MKIQCALLEKQRAKHLENAQRTKPYIQELTETAAKCGTDDSCFYYELMKAKNDSQHYEEAERITELLDDEGGGATFWMSKGAAGEWRWRLYAANNRTIADSGAGYRHKEDCLHAIELVKDAASAPVKERS